MITTSHSFYFILCISRAIISDLLVFTFVVIMRHKPTVIISDVQKNMKLSIPQFFLSFIFFKLEGWRQIRFDRKSKISRGDILTNW